MKYTIAIAGTTQRTRLCAEALLTSPQFEITWILTPTAKPVGRKQILTPNPLQEFAQQHDITTVFVEKKIDITVQDSINKLEKPDFLLVVDFGYIVPNWLLDIPKIAPLNIHPSELPKWRGSSPGQYSLLFNETQSAVTLMVMNEKLDQGPLIHQDFFAVNPEWDQSEYYAHAFQIMCNNLDQKIAQFAKNQDSAVPQPLESPTPTAKMIKKDETYVPWALVQLALQGLTVDFQSVDTHPPDNSDNSDTSNIPDIEQQFDLSALLTAALKHNNSLALTLERASKAFNPWPNLWTLVKTNKGMQRMKLLELELVPNSNTTTEKSFAATLKPDTYMLQLVTVQIEGKNPGSWNAMKSAVIAE